jgi:hypothetical protein
MTASGGARRPGRADLLTHVAADLGDCEVRRRSDGGAQVTAADGTTFDLEVRVERRKLMVLEESCAVVAGPEVVGHGRGRIVLHHTGQIRRRGLAARIRGEADDEVVALRDRLLGGGALEAASLPLDVTRFQVGASRGRWRAELLLMGGSHVRTRLPPGGSYVRLAPDQVSALLATVQALQELLPGAPPTPVDLPSDTALARTAAALPPSARSVAAGRSTHLPTRRR